MDSWKEIGYTPNPPLLVGEYFKPDWIERYGKEQIEKWENNHEILFVPVIKPE